MKYKIGQSVRVKRGILCPDDSDFDLSGWQGRIIDIVEEEADESTIGISWDSITLKEMPKTYIEKSEKEDLSWSVIYHYVTEVESVQPRDSEDDVVQIRDELEPRFGWISMGAEGELIQGVVNSAKSLDEWDVMKSHSDIGYRICSPLKKNLGSALDIIRHHHEKLDGTGYPDGLKGDDVSVVARVMAVADIYDALITDRPYRKGMPKEKAFGILGKEADEGKLDSGVVNCLLEFSEKE